MSWRGQGGRRAKGRRGDQDPELDSTAWLAELEQEAAQADDDEEDDWADTLRGRRSRAAPDPPAAAPPPPPQQWSEPSWAPPPDPAPQAPASDDQLFGTEPAAAGPDPWSTEPAYQEPPPASALAPDPVAAPDPDWSAWRPATADAFGEPSPAAPEAGGGGFAEPGPAAGAEPGWSGSGDEPGDGAWRSAGMDTPTGTWEPVEPVEPVGREPDYPALFGELYRRSAAQQDPIWEAPPAADPLPDPANTDPPASSWPFEETTQSWEPSDRSFIWPADELPSTPAEWDQPTPSWMDDPPPAAPPPPAAHSQPPAPPRPGPVAPAGPPPADWAAAIPTDVPAARRAADPTAASRLWQPDDGVDAEPAVPLGPGSRGPAARRSAPAPTEDLGQVWPPAPAEDPAEVRRATPSEGRRGRPSGERGARAWPRIVAVISWIVLVMVVCWFYVFPWLERVLPENF
jgi:hypothetical protein